jgi:hypothetical protein
LGNSNYVVVDEQIVVVMHLESFWKQRAFGSHTFIIHPLGAFFKVNDNQPMDLSQNQIMCYIIYHSGMALPEVLAMRTKCKKCLITYHKSIGIMIMKKHVEYDHIVLLKFF